SDIEDRNSAESTGGVWVAQIFPGLRPADEKSVMIPATIATAPKAASVVIHQGCPCALEGFFMDQAGPFQIIVRWPEGSTLDAWSVAPARWTIKSAPAL